MAFDKNIVSTKTFKNKYFAFLNIDFSPPEDPSLPPTPSAIVGITPEKEMSVQCFDFLAINILIEANILITFV